MVVVIVGEGEIVTDCRAVRDTDGLDDIRVDDDDVIVVRALREGELETREDEELLTE